MKHSSTVCRAVAVTEGELAKAGEQVAEYQHANRDLTTQAEESRQQLQVIHTWQQVWLLVSCIQQP